MAPLSSSLTEAAQRAVEALSDLREIAFGECGSTDTQAQEGDKSGTFSLAWNQNMTAETLAEQALRIAAESVSEYHNFRSGRIYCYACRTASCAHAVPAEPGQVFTGYASTGTPIWEEFFNFLLQLGDSRTDLLFADKPELLAWVVPRSTLITDQLTSFGKNSLTYRIWGEVVAGYLHLHAIRGALTVQVVETRAHSLHLQVLAAAEVVDALANAPASRRLPFHRVHDAISEARRQIASLSHTWQATQRADVQRRVRERGNAVLRHLAQSIERKGRQHRRRTAHAEVRGQQQRPVHKAHDDLKAASAADFYRDTVRNSVVVLGRGGRMHVFNDAGRHVTSMTINRDELARRRQRQRYVAIDSGTAQVFRDRILMVLRAGH